MLTVSQSSVNQTQQVENKVLLSNISWSTYESLLLDLSNKSNFRLTYDHGKLEIMSPQSEHERIKHLLELIIELIGLELNIDIECFGSTTFKRADLARGFEPDSCFYISKEPQIKDKTNIDLVSEPAPDLVIEVDITSPPLDKFPIYAQIGVTEIWRYNGNSLAFYLLSSDNYLVSNNSLAFPFLTSQVITSFLEQSKVSKKTSLLKSFSSWLKQQ